MTRSNTALSCASSNPKVAEEMLRYAAQGLQGISCMFDMVLFSGYLLTYAENLAF